MKLIGWAFETRLECIELGLADGAGKLVSAAAADLISSTEALIKENEINTQTTSFSNECFCS